VYWGLNGQTLFERIRKTAGRGQSKLFGGPAGSTSRRSPRQQGNSKVGKYLRNREEFTPERKRYAEKPPEEPAADGWKYERGFLTSKTLVGCWGKGKKELAEDRGGQSGSYRSSHPRW